MSLALEKIRPVKVVDTRLDLEDAPYFPVFSGGSKHTIQSYAPSSSSSSMVSFNITTPSPNVVVSRRILLQTTITLTFTGTTAPAIATTDSARSFPIASATNQLTLTLNNTSTSIPLRDVWSAMKHIQGKLLQDSCDTTPAYFDNAQQFSDFLATNRNALGGAYTSNGAYARGSFPYTLIQKTAPTGGGNGVWTISFPVSEPVLISPLQWAKVSQGMTGVQTMSLVYNIGDVSRMWTSSQTYAGGITAGWSGASGDPAVPLFSSPNLRLEYITPPITANIPKTISLPYHEVVPYSTAGNSMATSTTQTIYSSNVQLQSVPEYVVIFARRDNASESYANPDAFLGLRGLDITFNNSTGILSTATPQHLHEISRKNGVDQNWLEYYGRGYAGNSGGQTAVGLTGSITMLKFGSDIPLDENLAPAVAGTFQFSCKGTFENTSSGTISTPTLYVVFIHEGVITLGEGRAYTQIGVVSQADVLDAKTSPQVSEESLSAQGGNFYNSVSDKLRSVMRKNRAGGGLAFSKGDKGVLGGAILNRTALKSRLA